MASKLPSADKLRELIDAGKTYREIGEMYGMEGNSVRKRCALFDIKIERPMVPSDYFNRKDFEADIRAGLKMAQIERKYGAPPGMAKRFASNLKIVVKLPDREIKSDCIVYAKRRAQAGGGFRTVAVSLPLVSMLVAHLEASV